MEIAALDELRIVLDPIGQIGLALALMLIMFSISLNLKVKDFAFLLQRRALFIGGVVAQTVVLPLLTFVLVLILQPPPSIALGMFVVACCPGGVVSNLFTYLSAGNVAYSISLTATSSALAALLTPTLILFSSQMYAPTATLLQSIAFDPVGFLLQTTILLAAPLTIGMILAARAPHLAKRLQKKVALAGTLGLIGVILYGTKTFFPLLMPALPMLVFYTMLHNAAAFATGAIAGLLLRADIPTRRALIFEVGIQNSGLALVILLGQFDGIGGAAAIAAVWSIWHLIAGSALVGVMRRFPQAAHH
jgi:BASS family bile acid:Na+ symporter